MTFWLLLAVNSVAFGGLLFLLAAGFSLIFGLMRIPESDAWLVLHARRLFRRDLSRLQVQLNFWIAALLRRCRVAAIGG